MTQTTGAMSPQGMYVGFSTDGSSWTEITGSANSVEVGGGDRAVGTANTFGTTTAIVKYGGKAPIEVTVRGVYSEVANEAFLLAQAAYDADSDVYIRWSPGGGDAGDYGYTTGAGKIINPPYPAGAADTPDPILFEFTAHVGSVTAAAIGTAGW